MTTRRRSTKAELASLQAELAVPTPAVSPPEAPAAEAPPRPAAPQPARPEPQPAAGACGMGEEIDTLARQADACLKRGVGRLEAEVVRNPIGTVAASFLFGLVIGGLWRRGR